MPVAFFDLDRTLIDCNSAIHYARFEQRNKRISKLQLMRSALWLALYHVSLVDMDKAYRAALAHFKGVSHEDLATRTSAWFHDEIVKRIQPGALEALRYHREQGHPLVILSSTSCYIAQAAAEAWNFDHWLANNFALDESGCLNGEYLPPLCYGPGKTVAAEAWAKANQAKLDDAYFYSDSYSDLPMLQRVGKPRVINPDPRLRRYARRNQWPVFDWSSAEGAVQP